MRNAGKALTLALQGGGSHGAYTWGVLDRLLEEEDIEIEAISGASAGAMNAVVLAHGFTTGGREGARAALNAFWHEISRRHHKTVLGYSGGVAVADPTAKGYLFLSRFFSPYQLNPLNLNPLRDILSEQVDFERLRAECRIGLFIATTRARTATSRIFSTRELTLDVLLASACLPSIHHSVEIDGEAYWDGGLTANPPLSILVYNCSAPDLLVVVLNPARSDAAPSTAEAISERLTEVSLSSTLSVELQSVELARKQAKRGLIPLGRLDRRLRGLTLHLLDSGHYMAQLDVNSRFNTDTNFIEALRDEGRSRAQAWLNDYFRHFRARPTIFDLAARAASAVRFRPQARSAEGAV